MQTIQDMIDNYDGDYYDGDHSVDADWTFYTDDIGSSVTLRVFFSASAMADRFVDRLGIDREDALDRVRVMVHSATYHECRDMPFDIDTEYAGEEVLCTDISGDYNGEDMDGLNRKFDPAVERVAYYVARIEDPDLR